MSEDRSIGIDGPEGGDVDTTAISPLGDIDGDGFDDMLMFSNTIAPFGGSVFLTPRVYFGSVDGPSRPTIPIEPPAGWMDDGTALFMVPAGDLDGDGYDDAAQEFDEMVFYGSADGFARIEHVELPRWAYYPGVIDMDADGYLDLVYHFTEHTIGGVTRIYVAHGGSAGIRARPPIPHDVLPGLGDEISFHRVDDYDRDGYAELFFSDVVDVYVLEPPWGASAADSVVLDDVRFHRFSDYVGGVNGGDVDGDGYADLALYRGYYTGPMDSNGAGQVTMSRGNPARAPHFAGDSRVRDPATGARTGTRRSSLLDIDSDGYDDHVWVANLATRSEVDHEYDFRLIVFEGSATGLPWSPSAELYRYPPGSAFRIGLAEPTYHPP